MDKVKTLGNYSPSEHNASKIVDVDGSAPTVRENHGTVTAIAEGAKRLFNIYGENRGTGFASNVWDKEANSPSLMTMGGGNRQPMIIDTDVKPLRSVRTEYGKEIRKRYEAGEIDGKWAEMKKLEPREDDNINTLSTVQKDNYLQDNLRIRKLTPTECFRLMGVKDEDSEKLANMSNSTKYHLAGDSIVTTVLMAIFGELLEVEWKEKVNTLHEHL